MEKELKPEESLKIIQSMVKASRQQYANQGVFMIVWAILLIIAALINYFLITSNLDLETIYLWIPIIWIAFPVLGGIISFILGKRQSKKEPVNTQMGNLLKFMWIGFGVILFFTIFFPLQNGNSPIPFILLLTAFAIYIIALGIKDLPFMIGSICVLILGVIAFWVSYPIQLLLFSLALILGYLIPGIMLNRKRHAIK